MKNLIDSFVVFVGFTIISLIVAGSILFFTTQTQRITALEVKLAACEAKNIEQDEQLFKQRKVMDSLVEVLVATFKGGL